MKKIFRIIMALIITAAAIWLSFRNIDLGELGKAFARVHYFWVGAAVANTVFSVYVLGWRWEILLRPQIRISLKKLFRFNILSQTINIAAPARMGELVRAYLVSQENGASFSFVLGTILIERLLDIVVFAGVWIVTPALMALNAPFAPHLAVKILFFLPALFLASFALWPRFFIHAASLIGKILPGKARERMLRIVHQALEAFSTLRRKKTTVILISWTIGLVLSQILTNILVFRSLGLPFGFGPALIVLLAIQVGSIPPSAPGKIGVFEYAVILALALFGLSRDAALTYGMILHVTVFLPKIILGLIYMNSADIRGGILRRLKDRRETDLSFNGGIGDE